MDKALYSKICNEKSGVPLFMQPWWLDIVCAEWDAVVTNKGDHVSGIWAYPVEKKMSVTMLRNPVLTPYLGPHVFYAQGVKDSSRDSYEYDTIAELMKQLPETKVWHLAIAPDIKHAGLFKKYKLAAQVQQTFLLDLTQPEETLLANMKESTRRNIKQAEKEVTITESGEYLKELYQYQQHTLTRKGRQQAYTLRQMEQVMVACRQHNRAALWVAKEGEKVQAIVWQVWDDERSYYLVGGQNPAAESYKAMTLLLWHSIKEAKRRGNAIFDFEGSMDEGVERFFRGFAGRRVLYLVLQKNESLLWKLKKTLLK
jgi:lipid II:glycine glycyltransferase (peptidoglycan interpeptide bridge formation enzyme)